MLFDSDLYDPKRTVKSRPLISFELGIGQEHKKLSIYSQVEIICDESSLFHVEIIKQVAFYRGYCWP